MQPESRYNELKNLFARYEYADCVTFENNRLTVKYPFYYWLADLLYFIVLILTGLYLEISSLIKNGISGSWDSLVLLSLALGGYFYLSRGCNSFILDFRVKELTIYKENSLSKIFMYYKRRIPFSAIEEVSLNKTGNKSDEYDSDTFSYYKVFIKQSNSGKRILLAEMTAKDTKQNTIMARAIKNLFEHTVMSGNSAVHRLMK